jgi:hypothetical protein
MKSTDFVEAIAIEIAVGNNGGGWDTHYTEAQRGVWRERAAKIIIAVSQGAADRIAELESRQWPQPTDPVVQRAMKAGADALLHHATEDECRECEAERTSLLRVVSDHADEIVHQRKRIEELEAALREIGSGKWTRERERQIARAALAGGHHAKVR